jgi:PA domain
MILKMKHLLDLASWLTLCSLLLLPATALKGGAGVVASHQTEVDPNLYALLSTSSFSSSSSSTGNQQRFSTPTLANHTWSTNSKVVIHIPTDHHNPQGEHHIAAGFGTGSKSTFRGSVAAYVKFVDDTLCQPLYVTAMTQNTTIVLYPKDDTTKKENEEHKHAPFFLMVNRGGGCSFVTKARHAQHMGAMGVIFADHQCLCSDKNCTDAHKDDKQTCQSTPPHVVNDGSAGDISIPSFLLDKKTSEMLKVELKSHNQPVQIEYTWGLPDVDHVMNDPTHPHVWYQLITTAYDEPIMDLETYHNLRVLTTKFDQYLHFKPRYALVDGTHFECPRQPENGACHELCTNGGRYCSPKPRSDIPGKAVVIETLRRLCIWSHYGEDSETHKTGRPIWWDYILFHMAHCTAIKEDGSDYYSDIQCIEDAFRHAKIDGSLINECMMDSGGVDTDVINNLLEEQLQSESGVVSVPAITVNKILLDEPSSFHLYDAMCTHYFYAAQQSVLPDKDALKQVPELCSKCYKCENKVGCVEHDGKCVGYDFHDHHDENTNEDSGDKDHHHNQGSSKKKGKGRWVFLFFLSAGLVGGGYYYYKQNQDEFGSSSGGGVLNGYFQLGQGES